MVEKARKILKRTISFFNNKYWLFLLIIVLISYGQMLWMQPWEDDNALFVKLSNLQAPVGFFGKGPLGEGVYKYAAVPFILIYKLFGYNVPAYFILLLLLYTLATLTIYKVNSYVLGEKGGRIAGFIFAAGYITSDSFWRMANSATTSISIIMISVLFYLYWRYFRERKVKWYFLALLIFFLSLHIAISRNHYLFAVVVFFEIIFLMFERPLKSILYSTTRLIPFCLIFQNVLASGDSRSKVVKDYVLDILHGQFYKTYGFFSSAAYLMVPDWIISKTIIPFSRLTRDHLFFIGSLMLLFVFIVFYRQITKKQTTKSTNFLFIFTQLIWIIFSKHIFSSPLLSSIGLEILIATLGGMILIFFIFLSFFFKKRGRMLYFFLLWAFVNIVAYSTYYPTNVYDTINRYLAHSFFAYCAVLGIIFVYSKSTGIKYIPVLIILFGVGNLYKSFIYQRIIIKNRSIPVKKFYDDLKKVLPTIEKGDILYFDVSEENQRKYRDAISAAMIPDSGSFEWRYGIYRYDFSLVSDFDSLLETAEKEKTKPSKIHSYWYSGDSLIDTSNDIRSYFQDVANAQPTNAVLPVESIAETTVNPHYSSWDSKDLRIDFENPINLSYPIKIKILINASVDNLSGVVFPLLYNNYSKEQFINTTWNNIEDQRQIYLLNDYLESYRNTDVYSSSDWQDREKGNLVDKDTDSVWQSDRTSWTVEDTFFSVKLPEHTNISRIIWKGGSRNNYPINYSIKTSNDNVNWTEVSNIANIPGDLNEYNTIEIDSIDASYIGMFITKTLGDDSPMISDFLAIPTRYEKYDIEKEKDFLNNPFYFTPDRENFYTKLHDIGYKGTTQIYWYGNKTNKWETNVDMEKEITYNGKDHVITINIPAGGTSLNSILLGNFKIPGKVIIKSVWIEIPKIHEIIG